MKVLFLTPSVRPLGARRSLIELVRALPDSVEPMVICSAEGGICGELREAGLPVAVHPQGAWRKPLGRLVALSRQIPGIRAEIARFRPDVIHANEFHIVPQAVAAASGELPVAAHVRLTVTPRQIRNYRLAGCRRIVAVSKAVSRLFDGSGIEAGVRVVYNGVDVSKMAPDGDRHAGVETWRNSQPAGVVVFGLFGLVDWRKNQALAVEALAIAANKGANVALIIAGDPFKGSTEYGELLKDSIDCSSARARLKWLPFQQDIAALYRTIDVNLLISNEEGFGRTIIEAGAAGKPSIGSIVGGIPELIEDGRTGWLLRELTAEALADLMVALSREQIAAAGEAARARVIQNFTIQAHVDRMIQVWQECLE